MKEIMQMDINVFLATYKYWLMAGFVLFLAIMHFWVRGISKADDEMELSEDRLISENLRNAVVALLDPESFTK